MLNIQYNAVAYIIMYVKIDKVFYFFIKTYPLEVHNCVFLYKNI